MYNKLDLKPHSLQKAYYMRHRICLSKSAFVRTGQKGCLLRQLHALIHVFWTPSSGMNEHAYSCSITYGFDIFDFLIQSFVGYRLRQVKNRC